jgi:hypothetical protein
MLRSSRVAAQLAASREGLGSMSEWVSEWIGGLAIAALPWMYDLWSLRRTLFVEKVFMMIIQLFCHLCYNISVIILLHVRRSLSVSADFHPLFLFADVVFPWFVYDDITSETVALDTPNNVAVCITDAPAKRALLICPLSKSDKSPISEFFHADSHSAQPLIPWCENYIV